MEKGRSIVHLLKCLLIDISCVVVVVVVVVVVY